MKTFLRRYWQPLVALVLGLLIGWQLWHHAPVVEGPAFAKQLPHNALEVERDPGAKPPAPIVEAAHDAGGTPKRFIHMEIQPLPPAPIQAPPPAVAYETLPPGGSMAAAAALVCPPVDVDLALVEKADGTLRAVLTSSGKILEAKDIPVRGATARAETHWAVGASAQAIVTGGEQRHYGAWVERDLGPFRLAGEVQATARGRDASLWARVGVRF